MGLRMKPGRKLDDGPSTEVEEAVERLWLDAIAGISAPERATAMQMLDAISELGVPLSVKIIKVWFGIHRLELQDRGDTSDPDVGAFIWTITNIEQALAAWLELNDKLGLRKR